MKLKLKGEKDRKWGVVEKETGLQDYSPEKF
jgi:hypothetical protein